MEQPAPGVALAPVAPVEAGLHARVLDNLGTAICGGELRPGMVLNIDDLVDRYAVSRSVVREVLRVLASIGFIETRRRVGVMIRPSEAWNVFDPQVIRWRLASSGRIAQLRSITELRTAVEPHAAWLAAQRVGHDEASDLVGLAAKMWAAGKAGDEERFLELDIDFHRRLLVASGNEMFVRLQDLVAEVLTGRHQHHLMPHHPHEQALQLHAEVAQAIQRRDGDRARRAMVQLTEQAFGEMSSIWERTAEPGGR
ncbi:GntR family transcriptional regulator [Micromonospora echinospora]|uniref:Transcriptional regulator, GntR family n=1 Tax=Micromonospora echinospora TaxID=1877 RepID=A0A1C4YE27_MICEC|nr:FCD domain-containing protein [Micromonospora echinospora]OZV84692.1 GntR family transcriptional regulator [Micromonospora echinospora]SCF19012.1 transcriptional regulator, GntR family [Micromonospora echinospora]